MDVRRLLPIGAVVTLLLVVAGLASHGRPLRPGVGTGPSATFFDYVATTSLLFAILTVAVVAYALRTEGVDRRRPRGRLNILGFVLTIAASAILAGLLTNSKFEKRLRAAEQKARHHAPPQAAANEAHPNVKNLRNARIRWDEIAIVLLLVGGVGVYLYLTRDGRRSLRPLQQRRRTAVTRALDDSIDDLRRDPDLRRAIVAAYARMETALAYAGVPRAPAEAPSEYLERSLVELDAGGEAARRLTDLFQRAKFSQHEPEESMRDDAIDALVVVRDDLRRTAPEPVPA